MTNIQSCLLEEARLVTFWGDAQYFEGLNGRRNKPEFLKRKLLFSFLILAFVFPSERHESAASIAACFRRCPLG